MLPKRADHARAWPKLELLIADGAPEAAALAGRRVELRAPGGPAGRRWI